MIQRVKKSALHAWHRVGVSGLAGIVVLFIIFSLVIGSVRAIHENFQRQLEVDEMAQEVEVMRMEVQTLRMQTQYYQTDEYLELQARELLGVARPGEKVLILPTASSEAPAESAAKPERDIPLQDRSNIAQWLYFLFSDKRINDVD